MFGGPDAGDTGRFDLLEYVATGPEDGPTMVLSHGFGANMHDLVPLAAELGEPRYRFIFPQAPVALPGYPSGRTWFPRDERELEAFATGAMFSDLSAYDPPGLAESGGELAELLDSLGLRPESTVIGGFSQGSVVSCELVLGKHWGRPAGLVVLSGSLIAERRWRNAATGLSGLPVFQSHGNADTVLPEGQGVALGDLLREGGAEHTFLPFTGGHEIPGSVVAEVAGFLSALSL